MSYITIDILCPDCTQTWEDMVDKSEMADKFKCPYCLMENAEKTFSVPNVIGKASYRDGYKRPGFRDGIEASKLKAKISETRSFGDRMGMSREIHKLNKSGDKK